MYNFYEDNSLSGFIKYLLSKTKLPIYNYVHDGDFLIKGCNYIYKANIIRCLESGILNQDRQFTRTTSTKLTDKQVREAYKQYLIEEEDYHVLNKNECKVDANGIISIITGVTLDYKNIIIPSKIDGGSVKQIVQNFLYQNDNVSSLFIDYGVTTIDSQAFRLCTSLESVIIPDSVTSIGNSAFRNCEQLTQITIPNRATIGNATFQSCTGLTNVTIPNSVTTIGDYAFDGCTGLTDIYYTGTSTEWDAITKGSDNDPLGIATIHYGQTIQELYKLNSAGYYSYGPQEDQITPVITLSSNTYSQRNNWHGYTGNVVYSKNYYYKYFPSLKENTQELDCYVYLVPVKFDKDYTIAMDSIQPIYITAVLADSLGRIKKSIYMNAGYGSTNAGDTEQDTLSSSAEDYLDSIFSGNIITFDRMTFRNPQLWKVSLLDYYIQNVDEYNKQQLEEQLELIYHEEDNLYMLIQVPKTNTSSIVVLEGDYRNKVNNSAKYITSQDSSVINDPCDLYSALSLLQINTGKDILPFSNRLIEYLLQNVIDPDDRISYNIYRTQRYISYPTKPITEGVWDNGLQIKLFTDYMNSSSKQLSYKWDITGFVDKDVEKKITKGKVV